MFGFLWELELHWVMLFFFGLSQSEKCFFFQVVGDRYMLKHKGGRARGPFCSHTSKSCFCLSSVAKEAAKMFPLTELFCAL